MAQHYTPIWDDWAEVTQELNDQEKGRLIDAIVVYDNGGDWQERIKGNERYVFPGYKARIDRWKETCDNRKTKEPDDNKIKQKNQIETKKSDSDKINKTHKDKDKDKVLLKENSLKGVKEKTAARFTPPTTEEVTKYCQSRKNDVDPQRFVDFYASKGWKIGSSPMKDWKAAVRTWEQRSDAVPIQKPKLVRAQMYEQRDYDETEMEERLGVRDLFKEA